nr:unnamed protein product [Spirometra erinaceieuropaei]
MTDLCQRTMAGFKKKLIRILIQECHPRIRKYRREIEQHFSTCQSIFAEHEMEGLEATILSSAHCRRRLRDSQLVEKFERISPTIRPLTGSVLVHNHSSRHLTQQQLAVLSYDTKFNTRAARPEDFIASFESALQNCEANEECKNPLRQQVSTPLHKPQGAISETEDQELLRIRKIRNNVTLPADKGRSAVVMDKTEYTTKRQSLLENEGAYELWETGEFKKHVNIVNRAIDMLRKAGGLKRKEALAAQSTDAAKAYFYGLPKVHKPGVPTDSPCIVSFTERDVLVNQPHGEIAKTMSTCTPEADSDSLFAGPRQDSVLTPGISGSRPQSPSRLGSATNSHLQAPILFP